MKEKNKEIAIRVITKNDQSAVENLYDEEGAEKEAEQFDRSFPPKEKSYRKSQEEFYIYCHSSLR